MKRNKKSILVFFLLGTLILFFSQCIHTKEKTTDPRGNAYAGSTSCQQCHKSVYDSYVTTAHNAATKPSSKENINGSFASSKNIFYYFPYEAVVMQDRDSGLYQVDYINGKESEAHPFDITFGVKNGQTYLYWNGDKTFQLPVSYYSMTKSWGNSPGFSTQHANFNRLVGKECFECHASFIKNKINSLNTREEVFEKSSLVYGIDCERCHGPAADHVKFHLTYPEIKQAKYLVSSSALGRQQKLDMCAVCHSGSARTKEIRAFYFKLGDTLPNSTLEPHTPMQNAKFDVHGNQLQLLASSECFIKSKTLTCTTCHDTNASANLSDYSAKCISCHQNTTHNFDSATGNSANLMKGNCIDCHMPKQASMAITFQTNGRNEKIAQILRTHKIAIYNQDGRKLSAVVGYFKRKVLYKG